MNARSAADTTDSAEEKDRMHREFYTYESPDPYAPMRAFDQSVRDRCIAARRDRHARTQARAAKVSGVAMGTSAAVVLLLATLYACFMWGTAAALALQFGALVSSVYLISNDVRISVADDDRGWRRRHRLVSFVLRQHHLDVEAE